MFLNPLMTSICSRRTEAENSFDSYFDRNENPEMDFPFYFDKSEFE